MQSGSDIEDGVFEEVEVANTANEKIDEELTPVVPMSIQIATDEIKNCLRKAKALNELISSAKTDIKKKYFRKKLHKNNEYALQVLTFINRYEQSRQQVEAQQAESISTDHIDDTTCEPQVV